MIDVARSAEASRLRIDSQCRPVYDDGPVQVWNGDARALPLPDGSVHLVVTSPPYNCRVAYDGYDDWLPWDEYWHDLIEPSMRECFRVLAPGGRLAVNLANVVRQDVSSDLSQLRRRPGWRWKPAGANGQPWSVMVAPRLWAMLEQIGFLPREQLTWIKALNPEDIVTSTAWGSWRSASNPVLRAVAERCSSRARSRTREAQVYRTSHLPSSRRGRATCGTSPSEMRSASSITRASSHQSFRAD